MEDIIQRIWDGTETVQSLIAAAGGAADVSARNGAVLKTEEATQLVQCMHRACFANATLQDSSEAAAKMLSAHQENAKSRSWLQQFILSAVVEHWFDPSIVAAAPAPPSATNARAASVVAADDEAPVIILTLVEEQVKLLADCILDDREPQVVLTYENVLTIPNKPLKMYSPLRDFVKVTSYPTHPHIYTSMWSKFSETEHKTWITFEDFAKWFTFFYRAQNDNSTPSRAMSAAKSDWLYTMRSTGGTMGIEQFINAAKHFATRYARKEGDHAIEAYYTELMNHTEKESHHAIHNASFYHQVISHPRSIGVAKTLLVDAKQVYRHDDLDADRCEDEFFTVPTENRILLVGPSGVGKSTLAKEVAKQLNAVYVDVFETAVKAVDAAQQGAESTFSAAGREVLRCAEEGHKVSLQVRAQLAAHVLADPATRHLGYVFDDTPTHDPKQLNEYLEQCGIGRGDIPQCIVNVQCTEQVARELALSLASHRAANRDAQLARRREEHAAIDAKAHAKAEREAKRAAKAARADRKAKIEAGEIQATEEDNIPHDEEEDIEEPAELDEEGNPMEPEAVVARDAARARDRARRILLEDIRHAVLPDNTDGSTVDTLSLPVLAEVVSICRDRRRIVDVGVHSTPNDCAAFIATRLSLQLSTSPKEIPLPEDVAENPDGSADNDIPIADAKLRVATEGGFVFSRWRRFCPVTYMVEGVLVEGSMAFSVTYRGKVYCFASQEKMNKFKAEPHPFLVQRVTAVAPVLLLKRTLDVFKMTKLDAKELEHRLAESLGLTLQDFGAFSGTWDEQRRLAAGRLSAQTTRIAADTKQRAAREDRLKKRLEAEAKKKKKNEADKKKPAKKKEDENAAAEGDAPVAEGGEPVETVIVETTRDRINKLIQAEITRRENFCPLLVSFLGAHIDEATFLTQFEDRVLPPTVVVLDYQVPRPEGEEEAPPEEEDEEPEEEAAPEELDEDGNPKPKPPPKPKIFDPTDDKQYRRLLKKLIGKLNASTEASGSDPEPPAEGQPAPKPFQAFNVISMNVFDHTLQHIVDDIVLAVHPVAVNAVPPQDGEDFAQDPEIEEGDTRNPLLIPGPKAIHQFGKTLKYCPVTLKEKRLLVAGDPANWLSFKGKKYMFISPEAMQVFKRNPSRYTTDRLLFPPAPPPRLWVVGVPYAGKRTLSGFFSTNMHIPIFRYDDSFFSLVSAAALSDRGALVDGMFVPSSKSNPHAIRAGRILEELKAFDDDQAQKLLLKEKTQKEQTEREEKRDAGEEVEDLDEEEEAEIQKILEFEPEEAETKEERLAKARRQIAASLMRVEPYESSGYFLVGRPNSEAEAAGLLDELAVPDAVVHIKISVETFVTRQLQEEFKKRVEAQRIKQDEVVAKRKAIQLKQREIELRKWRRRNIGADDANDDEVEEMPEDVEPISLDTVRSELEGQYDTESGNVSSVTSILPDRRVPLFEVSGDGGREQLIRVASDQLHRVLQCRGSMFQAAQVCTYDEAMSLVNSGQKMLSSFALVDPVTLADDRDGKPLSLKMKPSGSAVEDEAEIPAEAPPAPKEKKMRKVTKTNDEGEEVEVEEEDPDEDVVVAEEPEPEEPLEPEPEFSPEEIDEMRKEFEDKLLAVANKKKRRAAILGHRVYFFNNDTTLLRFVTDPLKYWNQPPPLPETEGTIVCVFEPTQRTHGDTKPRTMAEHLAYNVGAVYLNVPKLLQWAVLHPTLGTLQVEARKALVASKEPSSDVLALLMVNRIKSADVQLHGAVLDNLPRDAHQVKKLYEQGVHLAKVFLYDTVLEDVTKVIAEFSSVMHETQEKPYSMASLNELVIRMKHCIVQNKERVLRTSLGFPASIFRTPTLESTIREHLSQYLWYCPYMWTRHEQLVEVPTDRRFVVEYLGRYFCLSNEEYFKEFLVHPEAVSGESLSYDATTQAVQRLDLPKVLPTHLSPNHVTAEVVKKLELAGCCPVTLYQTRLHVGLRGIAEPVAVLGDAAHFVAEYDHKYYALRNAECMTSFLRQPWVFAKHAVLPAPDKLPFDESSLKHATDEVYVSRTMKEAAARAMLAVCRARPKYPGLTPQESALKYMALYLKANNPKNSEIAGQQYSHNFELYAQESSLYKTITTEAPEDEQSQQEFHKLCQAWDRVQDHPNAYKSYIHLRKDHDATL